MTSPWASNCQHRCCGCCIEMHSAQSAGQDISADTLWVLGELVSDCPAVHAWPSGTLESRRWARVQSLKVIQVLHIVSHWNLTGQSFEGKPILDCWSDSLAFCLLPFVVGLAQIWGTDYHCLFYVYVYYSHSATKHEQDVVKYAVLQSSAFQVLTWSSFQLMTSMSKSTAAAHARCGSVNLLHAHVCLWSSATAVGYEPMSWKRMPSSMGHIAAMTGKTVTTG